MLDGQVVESVDRTNKDLFSVSGIWFILGFEKTIKEIIENPLAYESGLGYEEWVKNAKARSDVPKDKIWLLHDPQKFDENGFVKDDSLKLFIRENFYLSKDILDYDNVETEMIF